jgi:hypothetical protein
MNAEGCPVTDDPPMMTRAARMPDAEPGKLGSVRSHSRGQRAGVRGNRPGGLNPVSLLPWALGRWASGVIRQSRCAISLATLLLSADALLGENLTNAPATTNSAPPALEEPARKWSFSASVMGYLLPDSHDYVQPTITADRDWLHLEARYNYEALKTGSTWVGANFSGGRKLEWEITPMLGGVFGDTTGVAPGYKGSLRWWKLELYSEGEYVFDTGNFSGSYFYNWSELSLAPVAWFRFGLVTQRTHTYQTDREIQRGLLAGLEYKRMSFTTYVFNPEESRPTIVLAASLSF